MSGERSSGDEPADEQARKLEALRQEVGRIEAAQDRADALKVLENLEQIHAEHRASQERLAESRRRLRRRAWIVGALAAVWLLVMVIYHV